MKKLISFIIAAVLAFSAVSVAFAAPDVDMLRAFGIVEDTSGLNGKVTKQEFASYIAKAMGSGNVNPVATRYTDVVADNIYSGYIEFIAQRGIIDNTSGIRFGAEDAVNINMANKMLVMMLGYGEEAGLAGGYPVGYNDIAVNIGLHKGLALADAQNLSKAEALELVEKALTTETAFDLNRKSGRTLLSSQFGVSVYSGVVEKADFEHGMINFTVQKNKYETNPVIKNAGEMLNLNVSGAIDISRFEHVPAEIWVNSNEKVVYITPQKNVGVKFMTIDSVNGDKNANKLYTASSIDEIGVLNDEFYDFATDGKLYNNGKLSTTSVRLTGRVCKVIFSADEIIALETWDYVDGGIITGITEDEILYKNNSSNYLKLKDVYGYDEIRVVIDGRSATLKELKTDSVFDYYADNNSLVIFASEKTVVDNFESYSSSKLTIGNGIYFTDKVYFSNDSIKYTENAYGKLLGSIVKAYFSPTGKIKYVELSGDNTAYKEYYALYCGFKNDSMDEDEAELLIWVLDENPCEKIVGVNKKTEYVSTSLSQMRSVKAEDVAANVYVFTENANGKIIKIEKAPRFFGFSGDYKVASAFSTAIASVKTTEEGNQWVYFDKVPVTVVYEKNGELCVKRVDFNSNLIGRKTSDNTVISLFADEEALVPQLVLLWGDLSTIGSRVAQQGIFLDKQLAISGDGEVMYQLTVLSLNGKKNYLVNKETADKLNGYSFITYYDSLYFSDEDMYLSGNPVKFNGTPDKWEYKLDTSGINRGAVVRASKEMLVLEMFDEFGNRLGEKAYSIHPSLNFFAEYDSSKTNNPFKLIDATEISKGDVVFFNRTSDGIKGVIVIK